MGDLETWLVNLAAFIATAVFLYFTFDVVRRLLARAALRICRMGKAPEGGLICELKRKLHGCATQSLIPRMLMLTLSFGVLVVILFMHPTKL
jgi:hypothetical protein